MSRYIDADALINQLIWFQRKLHDADRELTANQCIAFVENAPTVDAVPVEELKNRNVKFYDKGKAFEVFFPIGLDLDTVNWVKIRGREFVPVVRCRDCKHFELAYYKKDGTENFKYKRGVCCRKKRGIWVYKDWYCADGERREDE